MEFLISGMETRSIHVAGQWLLVHLKIWSLACEFYSSIYNNNNKTENFWDSIEVNDRIIVLGAEELQARICQVLFRPASVT